MSLGSPGGPAIMYFVANTPIATLNWGLNAQQALDLPNSGSVNGPTLLKQGLFPPATLLAWRACGHTDVETDLTSGLQAIQRRPGGWFGAADPRCEGVVIGQ